METRYVANSKRHLLNVKSQFKKMALSIPGTVIDAKTSKILGFMPQFV